MSKGTTKKIAIGALLAGAAGYVAGVLTAPKSGKETRADVKKAAGNAKSATEKQLKKVYSELSSAIEKAQSNASKLKNFANQDLNRAIKGATKAKDKAKKILSAVHEGEADDRDLQQSIDDALKALNHLKTFVKK